VRRTRTNHGGSHVVVAAAALAAAFALVSCTSDSTSTSASVSASVSTSASATETVSPTPSITPASWSRIADAPVKDYYITAAVWDGTQMLVVITQSDPTSFCRELIAAYSPDDDSWRILTKVPTPVGCFEGSDKPVWTGKELLLWGISNTAYNPETDTWRHLPHPPAGDGGPSVIVWTGTQMIGWGGGCCDEQLSDGAVYTLKTNSWKKLPPSPLAGRHATGVWTGSEMMIFGGEGSYANGSVTYFRDAAAYDPAKETWRKLPPMPPPTGGTYYSGTYASVWDGTEVLLIGGRNKTSSGDIVPLDRVLAFDPAASTYRWLPPMDYARSGFVSAWTGERLIVWGGTVATSNYNAPPQIPPYGESYDPVANAWSPLPKAPLRARVGAVAVWSGDAVLIWGGWDARKSNKTTVMFSDGAALTPPSG
jgi:hypothetical protein